MLLARIRGDKEQLVYASEPDDTLPGTTLLDAVENGRWNEARGLIRSHVDVNATNTLGQTALHLADDLGVIDALLRFGAKQDIVDNYGNTPMQAAIERGDHDAQHLMMKYKYQTLHGVSARR
ncbi:ankyrin repeat domain-containing protein [Stenotrophomonas maltophilia]|nr:ankyrin repeat domain-containing protein [Stenotrophomonas maltophilia]